MTEHDTQKSSPPDKKPFNFVKNAIRATEVAIQTDCEERGVLVPQGHELRKQALQRLRSSSQNGPDSHLGNAEPRF